MIWVRISLEPEQYDRLAELAVRQSKSISQLVREGVDCRLLAAERETTAWDRFLASVGSCRDADDAGDVSAHHDRYLSGALARKFGKTLGGNASSC